MFCAERSDFEIYKTQVAICAWCALAVIGVLIGAVIYAFFLIRKVRNQLEGRICTLEATRRFTISRPKVYSSSDPTGKLQGELVKALGSERNSQNSGRTKPSPLSPPLTPLSPTNAPHLGYLNQGYPSVSSPGLTSLYSNLNSAGDYPNINLRSPSTNSDRNINRIESFLNKTRQLYSQSSSDNASPRIPRTPNGNGNKSGNVFQFS